MRTPKRTRTTGASARSHRDAGFTLTEIVVAVVLMGIVVIPIMDAVTTGIRASSRSRSAAQVETMVVNAADRVNRAPKSCDYYSYARAAVVSQGWADSTVKVEQAYYQPALITESQADLSTPGSWVFGSTACRLDEPNDLEVQLVRVTITSPDGKISRTIEVVKSDV